MHSKIVRVSIVALSFGFCAARAQTFPTPERLEALRNKMGNVKNEAISKLPPKQKALLSGASLNYLAFAENWHKVERIAASEHDSQNLARRHSTFESKAHGGPFASSTSPIPVNANIDFLFSVTGGFTQSETSTAWCGTGVVVGFNDSGSLEESLLLGPGGLSFSGAGASTNGGASFRDVGYINPGANPLNFLFGDPVVSCSDASTFYYSQVGAGGTFTAPTSDVFVSKSTDGGFTWPTLIPAVSKDAFTHFLDKDWSTIDPKNPKNLYVTYTDFDFTFTTCPHAVRIGIEIVHSTNGGNSWSAPTVVDQVCTDTREGLQNSQVVVDSKGHVFVEWEHFSASSTTPNDLRIARSTNKAASFQPYTKIADVFPVGNGAVLQGNFRDGITGNLAVDRSGTASDGNLYVVWDDGRFLSRTDLLSFDNLYHYANVLLSHSADGGKTWSAPLRVNSDQLQGSDGSGRDHYQPAVAVDSTGLVASCWYDRRDAALNYGVTRYCGTSTDQGATFDNLRVDPSLWAPVHDTDSLIATSYLGDYDTLATDKLQLTTGFQGAYGNVSLNAPVPNQDVFLIHLQ